GPMVLLIDQCRGDASVPLGLAGPESFERMLAEAQRLHPGHRLVIKTHPDVLAGKRKGYLASMPLPADAVVVGEDVNPYCLIEPAEAVHVVTSLMGMEGLIAGKPV